MPIIEQQTFRGSIGSYREVYDIQLSMQNNYTDRKSDESTSRRLSKNPTVGTFQPAQAVSPRSGAQVLLTEDFGSITDKFTPPSGWKVTEDFNLYHNVGSRVEGGVTEGAHSLTGDPLFVDPGAADYHLGKNSAAIDAGVDIGITHDLDGSARPQGNGVDIGAYEIPLEVTSSPIFLPLVQQQ